MSEWKEIKLGDLLEKVTKGTTPPKGKGFVEKGINYIKSEAISYDGNIDKASFCHIDEETHNKFKRSQLETDDILFSMAGVFLGKNALVKKEHLPANTNQALAILRLNKSLTLPKYVSFYLRQRKIIDFVNNMSGQSAQPNINFEEIKSIPILLPPLPEQKAIASVLSSLDDKIDLLHRQNKTLEAMAETFFRQWFVEEAEDDWEEGILNDIIDFNPKYSLKKGSKSPYLEMKNVSTSTFNPDGWYYRDLTSGMKFKNGDTVIARITPCLENGKTCHITFLKEDQVGWGSTEYIVMRMKEPYHKFISYLIAKDNDFRDFAISSMTGSSGRQRAQAEMLKEYELKIPTSENIRKMNEQSESFLNKLKYNSKQIQMLENLRDTLLPKLMSGEVRVII